MSKVRRLIVLLLIAGALWHFYGDTFERYGVSGVFEDMKSDINGIKENPVVQNTIDTISYEFQILMGKLKDDQQIQENEQPNNSVAEKPELDEPSEQSFSVHNIEIGNQRSEVKKEVGEPQRSTLNEYGVHWDAFHDNYQNFFMVAYDEQNQVAGLFTNQDLFTSTQGISIQSSKDSVLSKLGEPLKGIQKGLTTYRFQNDGEYNTFLIDNNYVTIFYDKHQNNKVTAIQIITRELERQKDGFFGEPSDQLREGFEYQLFDLTNAARVKHGLDILNWAEPARKTGRDHSKDMAVNNYFGHTNLEGQSPFDRLLEDDIDFQMAGENLASGQSSSIFSHEGLMNSLGHRENILKEGFRSLAVGVAFNEEAQPFYTEMFLTK
ncbi:CAP domain-containing protein [Salinibacillus xinjiangensis]|uniref:Serine protease n=1 Tax=Salinibacillus xinjiangensis TaxID=1229268 RepID=A0A6G1X884_9BACI|nr:CAP-associated domain-containing protein [Salinibacillus xinjiangensis]MRG87152.1 serine protease [Salinibacillus xinjiangensis]